MRRAQAVGARKSLEERADIIREFAVGDVSALQDMPGEHVKVKGGRNREVSCLRKNRIDEAWMIEHSVAGFDIAQEIDQRNVLVRRTGESADDELKIRGREPRPTIRLDHPGLIISFIRARRQGLWRTTLRLPAQ